MWSLLKVDVWLTERPLPNCLSSNRMYSKCHLEYLAAGLQFWYSSPFFAVSGTPYCCPLFLPPPVARLLGQSQQSRRKEAVQAWATDPDEIIWPEQLSSFRFSQIIFWLEFRYDDVINDAITTPSLLTAIIPKEPTPRSESLNWRIHRHNLSLLSPYFSNWS